MHTLDLPFLPDTTLVGHRIVCSNCYSRNWELRYHSGHCGLFHLFLGMSTKNKGGYIHEWIKCIGASREFVSATPSPFMWMCVCGTVEYVLNFIQWTETWNIFHIYIQMWGSSIHINCIVIRKFFTDSNCCKFEAVPRDVILLVFWNFNLFSYYQSIKHSEKRGLRYLRKYCILHPIL